MSLVISRGSNSILAVSCDINTLQGGVFAGMNEDELASLLNALEQGLSNVGLSSLVTQERISAVEGKAEKPSAQDLAELQDDWFGRGIRRTPRARADDVRIRTLTVGERLAELLDLIEVATGGTYAIEMRLRDDLKAGLDAENSSWDGGVVFADPPESELSETTTGEWALPDQSVLRQREAAVRAVIVLVNQLREQTELPRSERLHSITTATDDSSTNFDMPGDWS
jgi:hypothetical protein